jgi:hypothetical protein
MEKSGMYSKTALTCSGCAVFDRQLGHLRLPDGLDAQVETALLNRSGSRLSITSLRISAAKRRE